MSKFDGLSSGTERFLDWKKTNNPTAFFKTAEHHQKEKEALKRNAIITQEKIKRVHIAEKVRKTKQTFHQSQPIQETQRQKEAPTVGRQGYCSMM